MTRKAAKRRKGRKEVILLKDLASRQDVMGGSEEILFGQVVHPAEEVPEKRRPDR
jgi:hypothetical protein